MKNSEENFSREYLTLFRGCQTVIDEGNFTRLMNKNEARKLKNSEENFSSEYLARGVSAVS